MGELKEYLNEWGDDFGFVPTKPSRPLRGAAGSWQRVEDLHKRLEAGESLWSHEDESVLHGYCEDFGWVIDRGVDTKVFSRCRRWLYRRWQYWNFGVGSVCFVGKLNTELQWRRQLSLARRIGFSGVESVNLYSWVVRVEPSDAVGPLCDSNIAQAVMGTNKTVLCWGDGGARGGYVSRAIRRRLGVENIRTLGLDLAGNPIQISGQTTSFKKISEDFFDGE